MFALPEILFWKRIKGHCHTTMLQVFLALLCILKSEHICKFICFLLRFWTASPMSLSLCTFLYDCLLNKNTIHSTSKSLAYPLSLDIVPYTVIFHALWTMFIFHVASLSTLLFLTIRVDLCIKTMILECTLSAQLFLLYFFVFSTSCLSFLKTGD